MKPGNFMEPGTPGGTADINTKDRQEFATAAEKTNVNSEMANVQTDDHLEPKKPADMADVNTKDRQEFATAAEMANIKSEMADIKSEMANIKFAMANIKSDGRMEPKTPTGVTDGNTNDRQKSATSAEMANVTPEMAGVKFGNPPEPGTTAATANVKSGMATTQSTNAAVWSGTTLPIPAVIMLSSDPSDSPTPAPHGTEERTIEVIELSSDLPEGASSTPSTSHNSKRLRANSPDSASKRPRGSPAAEAKLQKKAGPS